MVLDNKSSCILCIDLIYNSLFYQNIFYIYEAAAISFAGNFNMHIVIKIHPVIHFPYFFSRLSSYVRRMLYGWIRIYIRIRFQIREILSDHRRRDLFALFHLSFFYDFIFIIDIVIIYYGTFDTDIRGKAKRTMTSCLHSNFFL